MPPTRDDLITLAQLPDQKTTSAPDKVFDVSQFKRYVNKDVSPAVIEQLQQEFGNDMAGAINKFHTMEDKDVPKSSELVDTSSDEKDEETNKDAEAKDVDEDPLGRKEFVTRDRYWDRYRRAYVLRKPTEAKASTKNKRYVIFARRDYEEDMKSFNTVFLVYGKILRNALRNIFQGAYGFSLTDNENSELGDARFLYWAKPELELLAEHYKSVDDKTASFEIRAGLNVIEKEYKDMISILPSLLPDSITFDHLWSLIPPGSLIVGQDDLDFTDIWRALSCAVRETQEGVFLVITAECVAWDGEKIGYSSRALKIPLFSGVKMIADLPYIPLKYHPEGEAVMQQVRQRSAKAIKFWTPGSQLQEHQGTGLAQVGDEIQRYAFSGRAIIDPAMMRSTQPSNIIMPSSRRMRDISGKGRAWISDLTTEEERPRVLEELLKDPNQAVQRRVQKGRPPPRFISSREPSWGPGPPGSLMPPMPIMLEGMNADEPPSRLVKAAAKTDKKPFQLSDEQMLLVSSLLYGYSLQDGTWGAFAVDRVADVVWNDKIFPSLVMEPSLKSVIYQLVTAHSTDASEFDDFVKGKGKGLIGLLFGPPGSGKTLTAEAVAETAKMPLYMVSSGALGHDPVDIQHRLSSILKLASHWKAVLLLDEADVFLAERTLTNIERNAIVSIFLRELEYYQGILLLTTNQAQVIDEAFRSRIHFSLYYPMLDTAARQTIWTNFLDSVRDSKGVEVDVTSEDTLVLAQLPLNGRQIKNAVSIAVKIAGNSKERAITSEAIISTAKLLQNQEHQGKRSRAMRDEKALEADYLKGHSVSTQDVDTVPVKPMPARLGQGGMSPFETIMVALLVVAVVFAFTSQ